MAWSRNNRARWAAEMVHSAPGSPQVSELAVAEMQAVK
jgi:hypothetical protein